MHSTAKTLACPQCQGQLAPFDVPEGAAAGCRSCGGAWVDDRAFAALRQGMEDDVVGVAGALEARPRNGDANERPGLRCPVCSRELIATEISRVRVDFCTAHGTWMDHGDVEAIADAVAVASSGSSSQKDWEARLTGDLGVMPKGLVSALGTVIAVGEHSRRARRPKVT
jgi:Zn-finger nucleic acid-binding protein